MSRHNEYLSVKKTLCFCINILVKICHQSLILCMEALPKLALLVTESKIKRNKNKKIRHPHNNERNFKSNFFSLKKITILLS